MQTYISILRGINVSGQKNILMSDLKALYEGLGFNNIVTYIQSGNVIFRNKQENEKSLSKKIEIAISNKYGFEVPVLIKSLEELEKIISGNPFLKRKDIDFEKLHVTFLAETPLKEHLENLKKYNFVPDEFIVFGKEVFLYIPNGYGKTKLSNSFFESKLKVKATTRNWKTVNKLAAH